MSAPFYILRPRRRRSPIVLSCPHSGVDLPADIAAKMDPELAKALPDTDWFVHQLYDFATQLGITIVHARYSRYAVDLNRDPAGHRLYSDQRHETKLVPLRSFADQPLYLAGQEPDAAEIKRRIALYFEPYHAMVAKLLAELRAEFSQVLFYDAHSIKRQVPSIRAEPFADMILGDQHGKTAAPELTLTALGHLQQSSYKVAHNDPFMGGYLTRRFGEPGRGVHALQLEMAQDIYMDGAATSRDPDKEAQVQAVLRPMLEALIAVARRLPPLA